MTPVLVKLTWRDAHADSSEVLSRDDVATRHRPALFETVGWLLMDDELGVSVANERCVDAGDEVYRGRTFVPRSLIKSIEPIKKKRIKSPKVVVIE